MERGATCGRDDQPPGDRQSLLSEEQDGGREASSETVERGGWMVDARPPESARGLARASACATPSSTLAPC